MYSDKRCHTCHALIRYCGGTARHCPNPAAVNQFFSMNGDTDINITEQEYVCSSCYNHHLAINRCAISSSTDDELRKLLTSQHVPPPWAESYTGNALRGIISKLGNILIKRLAVLFPEVYRCFIRLVIQEANASGITLSESQVCEVVSKIHNKFIWKAHGVSVLPEGTRCTNVQERS